MTNEIKLEENKKLRNSPTWTEQLNVSSFSEKDEVFSAAFVRFSKRIRSVQRRDRGYKKGHRLRQKTSCALIKGHALTMLIKPK